MAEGFDDFGYTGFDADKVEEYNDDQLNNYFDKIREERDSLYEEYSKEKDDQGITRIKYGRRNIEFRIIKEERNRRKKSRKDRREKSEEDKREKSESGEDSHDYSETAWIDYDMDYRNTDLGVLKTYGVKGNLTGFINIFVTKDGKVNEKVKGDNRDKATKFIRSFLSVSDGKGCRPLLNNYESFKLLKDTTFSRGGSVGKDGVLSILRYKGTGVREINIGKKDTKRKLNENLEKEKEFTILVNKIFSYNTDTVEKISKETKVSPEVVQGIIDNDNSSFISGVGISPELVQKIIGGYAEGNSIDPASTITLSQRCDNVGRTCPQRSITTLYGRDFVDSQ